MNIFLLKKKKNLSTPLIVLIFVFHCYITVIASARAIASVVVKSIHTFSMNARHGRTVINVMLTVEALITSEARTRILPSADNIAGTIVLARAAAALVNRLTEAVYCNMIQQCVLIILLLNVQRSLTAT
jgi:hypothetical protein